MATIQAIYRYPVKGLSAEPLARTALAPGETVPGDRLYAIENGPSGFDPAAPTYLAKQHFLMLMRNERLAALRTAFDHATHTLTITAPSPHGGEGGVRGYGLSVRAPSPQPSPQLKSDVSDFGHCLNGRTREYPSSAGEGVRTREVARGDLRTAEGRAAIERYFAEFCADELRGPPLVLHAPGHSFSDVARKVVSIINLASVGALADLVGVPVHPLRFRANVYVQGWVQDWPAWSELDLVGKELTIGRHARLKVVKRIVRCAATNVDPQTAIRDLNLPQTLMRSHGHADCGIYAEVVRGGEIAEGDEIAIL